MPNIKRANASGITKPGTAIADVPDAPTIGTATGGQAAATVTYTAAATGGTATTFTATSTPGSITGTGASPITISGLTNGTAYSFTVTASNSTGTSPASSASNQVTPISLGDMFPLGMVQVGSDGAANVTFSSIPATYKHLQIRGITRGTRANINTNVYFGFNNDTTTGNYYGHGLYGDGSSAGALAKIGSATNALIVSIAASGAANSFSGLVIDVLDYANTNKYKTSRSLNGYEDNSAGQIWLQSGLWMSTSAITSIQITDPLGNFAQYTSIALYGIKGE